MPLKSRKYEYDTGILKKYTDDYYRLTRHRYLRVAGVEDNEHIRPIRGSVNSSKLDESIKRASATVYEYGLCNPWDYFSTLTIDRSKFDRYDLKTYYKAFSQFLRDYNKKFGLSIKYVFVPERHKDGAWHMHGLIYGLPFDHLEVNNNGYYDWLPYSKNFGYISLDFIKDKKKVSSYITKYITKSFSNSVTDLNAKMYYCSRGLKKAEVIKKGFIFGDMNPTYSNEYVDVAFFSSAAAALALFEP